MPISQFNIDPQDIHSLRHNTIQLQHSFVYNYCAPSKNSMITLAPSALDQKQDENSYSLPTPAPSPQRLHTKSYSTAKDLNLNGFFSSSSSSLSSGKLEDGMDSPLTASSLVTSPLQPSASRLPSFESKPVQTLPSDQLPLAPLTFFSSPISPTNSVSPTSPLKVAFSSPQNHRNDPKNESTTFASFHNQFSPDSKKTYITQRQRQLEVQHENKEQIHYENDSYGLSSAPLSRSCSQLTTPTIPSHPMQLSNYVPPQVSESAQYTLPTQPRRMRVSTGSSNYSSGTHIHNPSIAFAPVRQHYTHSTLIDGGGTNNSGHRVLKRVYTSPSYQPRFQSTDSKKDIPALIPIHVRYVHKDLWVQVDVPRDIPVHKARDLILSKCRLTSIPPQTSTVSFASMETTDSSTESILQSRDPFHSRAEDMLLDDRNFHSDHSILSSPWQISHQGRVERDDDSLIDQESIDDDEAEMRAEELMGSSILPQLPRTRIATTDGLSESYIQGRQRSLLAPSRIRHNSHEGCSSDYRCESTSVFPRFVSGKQQHQQHALSQQQLNRLITYSNLHTSNVHGLDFNPDKHNKDINSSKRFSNIAGWCHYRSRQSSNSSKHIDREVLDHGGVLADHSFNEDSTAITETRKSECTAWKACFGLFWLAAGHWLDDSRLMSSYSLQPHCLLELQLRNNYIQLPPPGSSLNYYDHYAEGLLYKRSKKIKLGQGNKEYTGVWKERWVVLQGNRLFIYHKRKDTTKKSLELVPPLTVVTSALPQTTRHSFKLTSSSVSMSSSIISIYSSQAVPIVCFRASSESELNHWIRIFNSLNNTPMQGLSPPLDPHVIATSVSIPPPLPPLPIGPPPISMDKMNISTIKRLRHNSHTDTSHRSIIEGAYFSERKRSHTVQLSSTTPSINPALISNAAAVLSNLNPGNNRVGDTVSVRGECGNVPELQANYTIAELKYRHNRASCSSIRSDYKDVHQLERQALPRNSTISSYRNSIQSKSGEFLRQRTLTEPGYLSRMHSMSSQRSSQQMLRDQLQMSYEASSGPSTILDATENALRDLGDVSQLEPSVQALLKNSGTIIYSGYIWLYISNSNNNLRKNSHELSDVSHDYRRSLMDPPLSRSSSMSSTPTTVQGGSRTANICLAKASGQYVKCFAVINDQGMFQWIEVMNQEGSETSGQNNCQSDSQMAFSRFGFPLTSTRTQGQSTHSCTEILDGDSSKMSSRVDLEDSSTDSCQDRTVKASMAHKLRLYFFCIRISTSSTGDISVEFMDLPSNRSSRSSTSDNPPARTKKSPLREQHRLSGQPRMRTASSPLFPSQTNLFQTKAHNKTESMIPSFGRFTHLNPPVWPSKSPFYERPQPFMPLPTPSLPELLPIPKKSSVPQEVGAITPFAKNVLARTVSLFVENRSRSAPPESIFPTAASLARHSSYSGLLKNVIMAGSSNVTKEQKNSMHNTPSQVGTSTEIKTTPEPKSPTAAITPSSMSNVIVLAEDLQKVLQTRQEQTNNSNDKSPQDFLGCPLLLSTIQQSKTTLSELTFMKRKSIQQQQESLNTALNVERSRLKLIGVLKTLKEGGEIEDPADMLSNEANQDIPTKKDLSQSTVSADILRVLLQCPFMEQSEVVDAEGNTFLSLKGYTETEAAWKSLQGALENFLAGPIKDQRSALPPEDTLIPSYHAPRAPELRLSEKAQNFLRARDRAYAVATAAALAEGRDTDVELSSHVSSILNSSQLYGITSDVVVDTTVLPLKPTTIVEDDLSTVSASSVSFEHPFDLKATVPLMTRSNSHSKIAASPLACTELQHRPTFHANETGYESGKPLCELMCKNSDANGYFSELDVEAITKPI